ncbi:MAG: antibiotic biosynthesis monooxygenase [Dehalococcoidia bacterium]
MYVVYVETTDNSPDGSVWEAWKRKEGTMMKETPGWIKRILLRSQEDPKRFHYVTFWETAEQARAFSETEAFRSAAAALGVTQQVHRVRFDECDLILDEASGARTA